MTMKLFLLVFTLLYTTTRSFADCPMKCRCTHFLLGLYDSVQCSNMSLTELPSGNLDDILGKLDLSFNEFTILKNDMFLERQIDFLDKLMFNNNKITTIEVNAFRGLAHLTYLNIRHNNITSIQPEHFQGNSELRILNMNNNPNLQLPNTGFILPKLTILDMSECGLQSIPNNFFVGTKNLDILTLYGNQLTFMDPKLISPLRQLEYLDLRTNKFTQLQEQLLKLPLAIDIDLGGNPFHCDCELQKIYSIYKTRAHTETLVCHFPKSVEFIEPSDIECSTSKQISSTGTAPASGSLLAIVMLLLQVVINKLL